MVTFCCKYELTWKHDFENMAIALYTILFMGLYGHIVVQQASAIKAS